MSDPGDAIPMSVVGGFLGAGKTTLLNSLLRDAAGVRYAVLVNDFGDLAIDGDLVVEHGGETIALANGCICCTIGDDLLLTLMRLLERPETPDHILVEASGIADPRPIADVAVLHKGLVRDAVIVLVDAETVREKAADRYVGDTVDRQLAAADVIVLNKCDLIDAGERQSLRAWLAEQAPDAVVVDAEFARAPAALLLGARLTTDVAADPGHDPGHDHGHDEAFRAVTVAVPAPFDAARFRAAIEGLPDSVLRGKGFVRFSGDDRPHLFQMVGRRIEFSPTAVAGREDSRIVFLGTPEMPSERDLEDRLRQAVET